MFFTLSKLLDNLFMPLGLASVLLLLSLLLRKRRRWPYLGWAAFGLLWFFGNEAIVMNIASGWEGPVRPLVAGTPPYDAGVVLMGGGIQTRQGQLFYGSSVDRTLQTLRLYRAGKLRRVLISGGSGLLKPADMASEAGAMRHLLELGGVPPQAIVLEYASRNTHENAVFSTRLLKKMQAKRVLLITSAVHLPRAARCFEKAGLQPDRYPVDFISGDIGYDLDGLLIPKEYALFASYRLFHEWLGFLTYRLLGYC